MDELRHALSEVNRLLHLALTDEVSRALFEVYRLLDAELQRTSVYSLIQVLDATAARYPREAHFVKNVKNLQNKLLEQLREMPQVKMMKTVAALIDERAALMKPEVDLMSGVTVREDFALHHWENEGGSVIL